MKKENEVTIVTQNNASPSERFTNEVLKQYQSNNGKVNLTPFQNRLIQNYFIKLDSVLKESERKRLLKSEAKRDVTPITWSNVNMEKLATEVVIFSRLGLDPTLPNHLNLIPYKNNSTSKYDVTGIIGYKGIEIKAMKYGLDVPLNVIVELVYSNDTFKPIKKGLNSQVENYTFDISSPFDRGSIVGGFYYHVYSIPEKNKLKIFSLHDIEKRKPAYASVEFWGGEKDVWVNGKKTGTEKVEGWYDEMCLKTIYRSAYNDITLDAQKIDDILSLVLEIEEQNENKNFNYSTKTVEQEIENNQIQIEEAKTETISFENVEKIEVEKKPIENNNLFEEKAPF